MPRHEHLNFPRHGTAASDARLIWSALVSGVGLLLLVALALYSAAATAAQPGGSAPLRVCADADNLPFSNSRAEGFENHLAALVAQRLGRPLQFTWLPPATDLAALSLRHDRCDLVMAEPQPTASTETTIPYYWSSYVLLSRSDRHLDIVSLADPRLRTLRIGVEALGSERFFTPPARVLIERGLARNLVPFDVGVVKHGPQPLPASGQGRAAAIEALVRGRIDVAALWGPAVGALAAGAAAPLHLAILTDGDAFSTRKQHFGLQSMQYPISMAVRRGNSPLHHALDRVIEHNRPQIERLLESFRVPLIDPARMADATPASAAQGRSRLAQLGARPAVAASPSLTP